MWRCLAGFDGNILVLLFTAVRIVCSGPIGTITALATQTRVYPSNVRVSYFEPANCTLNFNENVMLFNPQMFTKASSTVISNFVQVTAKLYTFQLSSTVNSNASLSIAAGQVRNLAGIYNNATTATFSFEFYAYAPSVTLNLDGFTAQSTRKEVNIAYLIFNSTTQYDANTPWFNSSHVAISPSITFSDFSQVNDKMYRFRFTIPKNSSYPAVSCVAAASTPKSNHHTIFACDLCVRPSFLCEADTTYPPQGVAYMEFPLSVILQPVPILGLTNMSLPMMYDTLWAFVRLDAPVYAKSPFFITITWSEALSDLVAVQPTFSASSPPVDQNLLANNRTILGPTSFRLLIAPKSTGVVKISINGSGSSIDLAGNTNDFFRIPGARTGDVKEVIFSLGAPLPGNIAFQYTRPRLDHEYPAIALAPGFQQTIPPSLTISWTSFTTAILYDAWIQWGVNMTTGVVTGLNASQYTFTQFSALLGTEYQVNIRAHNNWGQSITVSRIFLFPKFDIIADGTQPIVALPNMLSPTQSSLATNVLIPTNGFLSVNPLKVLTFKSVNKSAGDQDPCRENSRTTECTYLNFHMEVPNAHFVVFREPMRLQFIFGRQGWHDQYYRPRLRYWETHDEMWRDVVGTCPSSQVFDRWNTLHKIYEISVCHLSQFAIFKDFEPASSTAPPPPPPRPESFGGAVFFIIFAGCIIGAIIACCIVYFACRRPDLSSQSMVLYKEMGIKPVSDRLPSRRLGQGSSGNALQDIQEPDQESLLALPAPGQDASALQDMQGPDQEDLLALPAPGAPDMLDLPVPQLALPAPEPHDTGAPLPAPPGAPAEMMDSAALHQAIGLPSAPALSSTSAENSDPANVDMPPAASLYKVSEKEAARYFSTLADGSDPAHVGLSATTSPRSDPDSVAMDDVDVSAVAGPAPATIGREVQPTVAAESTSAPAEVDPIQDDISDFST